MVVVAGHGLLGRIAPSLLWRRSIVIVGGRLVLWVLLHVLLRCRAVGRIGRVGRTRLRDGGIYGRVMVRIHVVRHGMYFRHVIG